MQPWEHDHSFGQDVRRPGEPRTLIVVVLTGITMVVEIAAGWAYGSMALLADGLHMASHATALSISIAAYIYARRLARDRRFSFGTGKVNSLAGFTGAILLALFAMLMASESFHRLLSPVHIVFDQALLVAVVGLLVNGLSVVILSHGTDAPFQSEQHSHHGHNHHHDPAEGPLHHQSDAHGHSDVLAHDHVRSSGASPDGHDHNLRSAYLHVLADAMTSLLAIFALLAAKYLALYWLDPIMGIVGATLVARWSIGLLKMTSRVLLDEQGPAAVQEAIRSSIARAGDEVVDLHLWTIGPGVYALVLSVVSDQSSRQRVTVPCCRRTCMWRTSPWRSGRAKKQASPAESARVARFAAPYSSRSA